MLSWFRFPIMNHMRKILLFGSTGFIGTQLKSALEAKGYDVASPRAEITDLDAIRKAIVEHRPDTLLNCAGVTGRPNVDWCETHAAETIAVNVVGALNVAIAASEKGLYLAHLGSGCVYSGDKGGKGFSEEDEPNYFGSVYSRTKFHSEKMLREFPNVLQLRIRIPIMGQPNPKNLIDKLVRYPKMINRMNSCSVMEDFIPASIQLMEMGMAGVFNMTNQGAMDHQSIMEMYQRIVDPSFKINRMSETEESELGKRRSNCVLNTDKREALGVHMPPLEESLRKALKEYAKAKLEMPHMAQVLPGFQLTLVIRAFVLPILLAFIVAEAVPFPVTGSRIKFMGGVLTHLEKQDSRMRNGMYSSAGEIKMRL